MSDDTVAVFCGNFEYDARAREIERLFEIYGPIDRVEMKTGFAFVYMKDRRDAEDAIRRLDGREFGGKRRILRVEFAKAKTESRRRASTPSNTLFVVNFDSRTTRERDLEDHFEKYGHLLRVNIRRNYAFVQYETVEEATEALKQTDGINFMGRPLTVEYCINDEKKARRSPPPYRRPSPPRFRNSPRGSPVYRRYRSRSRSGTRSPSPFRRSRTRTFSPEPRY